MNMFARYDENPAMTLRVIKETKRYWQTDRRTDNVKTVYPLQTKFVGGIIRSVHIIETKILLLEVSITSLSPSIWHLELVYIPEAKYILIQVSTTTLSPSIWY